MDLIRRHSRWAVWVPAVAEHGWVGRDRNRRLQCDGHSDILWRERPSRDLGNERNTIAGGGLLTRTAKIAPDRSPKSTLKWRICSVRQELTGIASASSTGLDPSDMMVFDNEMLFNGVDANGLSGLWVTDGTVAARTNSLPMTASGSPLPKSSRRPGQASIA
jgi:hypothetical protein